MKENKSEKRLNNRERVLLIIVMIGICVSTFFFFIDQINAQEEVYPGNEESEENDIAAIITTNQEEYKPQQEIIIKIKALNRGSNPQNDIDVRLESSLFEQKTMRINLGPGEIFDLEQIKTVAPVRSSTTEEQIKVSLAYRKNNEQKQQIETKNIVILKATQFAHMVDVDYTLGKKEKGITTIIVNTSLNTGGELEDQITDQTLKQVKIQALIFSSPYNFEFTAPEITTIITNGFLTKEITTIIPETEERVGINTEVSYTLNEQQYTRTSASMLELKEKEKEGIKVELVKKQDQEELVIKGKKEHIVKRIVMVFLAIILFGLFGMSLMMFLKKQRLKRVRRKQIQEIKGEEQQEQGFLQKMKGEIVLLETPKSGEGHEKLEKYIEYWLKKGRDKAKIKELLTKAGWLEEVVDVYIQHHEEIEKKDGNE